MELYVDCFAYRSHLNGSWFIQHVTNTLYEDAWNNHVVDITCKVTVIAYIYLSYLKFSTENKCKSEISAKNLQSLNYILKYRMSIFIYKG